MTCRTQIEMLSQWSRPHARSHVQRMASHPISSLENGTVLKRRGDGDDTSITTLDFFIFACRRRRNGLGSSTEGFPAVTCTGRSHHDPCTLRRCAFLHSGQRLGFDSSTHCALATSACSVTRRCDIVTSHGNLSMCSVKLCSARPRKRTTMRSGRAALITWCVEAFVVRTPCL